MAILLLFASTKIERNEKKIAFVRQSISVPLEGQANNLTKHGSGENSVHKAHGNSRYRISSTIMNGMANSSEDVVDCPLCMEPLEVDDLNFYPCTCGYQVSSVVVKFVEFYN